MCVPMYLRLCVPNVLVCCTVSFQLGIFYVVHELSANINKYRYMASQTLYYYIMCKEAGTFQGDYKQEIQNSSRKKSKFNDPVVCRLTPYPSSGFP